MHRLLGWQRAARRRRWGLFVAFGMILLVVLVVLLSLDKGVTALFIKRSSPRVVGNTPGLLHLQSSVHILPQRDGFACVVDATWSPDSKQIALLGYQQDCPENDRVYKPGLMTVYDAHAGRLLGRFSPDNAILRALRIKYSGETTAPEIDYNAILWSPDGRLLTVLFTVVNGSDVNAAHFEGVLLSEVRNGHSQVLLQREQASFLHYVEWDLESGKLLPAVPAPAVSPLFPFFINVSPAYTYRWRGDGTLIPETLLTNSVLSSNSVRLPGAVGNPIGDASFTIWQPGRIVYTTQTESGSMNVVGLSSWTTIFTAWSPDGRYLAYPIAMAGLFEPSKEQSLGQTLKDPRLDSVPLLAVRDIAMQHILELMPKLSPIESTMVSWRFDGRMLAAYGSGVNELGLYDSRTGIELASLELPTFIGGPLSGSSWMRWSPDGSQLFLLDRRMGIVVWKTR
jgi:dipeptidyl aminopeptidase/acylaminoacyl peptidase